jgi:hypothetical protein
VIGVAIYVGHDTKIMMNSIKAKTKKSEVILIKNIAQITIK